MYLKLWLHSITLLIKYRILTLFHATLDCIIVCKGKAAPAHAIKVETEQCYSCTHP
jgi:hypothetical protein